MKIFIADDDKDIIEFLSHNVTNANYSVITSDNGIDALKKIEIRTLRHT
jgi:DNA-binding response OmpR family regulator